MRSQWSVARLRLSSVTAIDKSSVPLTEHPESILEQLNVLLDSDVMIGRRVSEKDFLLLEVYRRRASECLVQKKIGEWTAGRGLRVATSGVAAARRMNLQKALIRAVMVVSAAVTVSTARAYLLTYLLA